MLIEIFDVGHGHCSVMTAPNGTRMMLDCGTRWDEDRFWTPSLHYYKQSVPVLAPLNLDEDHIADFDGMLKDCSVRMVLSNPSIGPVEFRKLKTVGMGSGAEAYLKWLMAPKGVGLPSGIDYGAVQIRYYYPLYGRADCITTNDLSMAVIIQFGSFKILFAGDLEAKGWSALLQRADFCLDLAGVTLFVASHHGRENGCHEPLFKYTRPDMIIISDGEKRHETQETDDWYRQRCNGAPLLSDPTQRRYVVTTRKDGSMRIKVEANGLWQINWGIKVPDWERYPLKKATTILTSGLPSYEDNLFGLGGNALGGLGLINRR